MSRLLIVEDEPGLLRALADGFRFESYEVLTAADGESGYRLAKEQNPDLIILDLMLPRMSGYDVCRKLRSDGAATLILMLTARGEEADRVVGLDLGADDYLTKPFSVRELSARVRALLRRAKPPNTSPDELRYDDVHIDFRTYEARRGEHVLDLTRKEFQLLRLLVSRPDDVMSREELLDEVWGLENYPTTRTVDTHVFHLRSKVERDPKNPRHLITVHGIGYRWTP
ncbi:MAG: response regulator transcription factor [Acidobacteria bacterium]|nr:response regulator transcription factor [Acidobacteriota bacterium]